MKKFIVSAVSVTVILLGVVVCFAPARNYSVRQSIYSTENHYKWEQWCYHESLVGFRSYEKVGEFDLVGKNITADSILETDVCD